MKESMTPREYEEYLKANIASGIHDAEANIEDELEYKYFRGKVTGMMLALTRFRQVDWESGIVEAMSNEIWEQVEIMQSGPRKARFIQILSKYKAGGKI